MREFDMGDRWIYRNEADGKYHGITDEKRAEKTIAEADVLVNVSGACWLRPVTAGIRTKLYLDGDPMFTHIELTCGDREYLDRVRAHERHFTFGLNVGRPGCKIPPTGLRLAPHRSTDCPRMVGKDPHPRVPTITPTEHGRPS